LAWRLQIAASNSGFLPSYHTRVTRLPVWRARAPLSVSRHKKTIDLRFFAPHPLRPQN
jgi:hypothetical protein